MKVDAAGPCGIPPWQAPAGEQQLGVIIGELRHFASEVCLNGAVVQRECAAVEVQAPVRIGQTLFQPHDSLPNVIVGQRLVSAENSVAALTEQPTNGASTFVGRIAPVQVLPIWIDVVGMVDPRAAEV